MNPGDRWDTVRHGGWGELTDHMGSPPTEQERLNRKGWTQGLMGNAEADSCVIHVSSDVGEDATLGAPHTGSRETGKPQNVTVLRRKTVSAGKGSREN